MFTFVIGEYQNLYQDVFLKNNNKQKHFKKLFLYNRIILYTILVKNKISLGQNKQ